MSFPPVGSRLLEADDGKASGLWLVACLLSLLGACAWLASGGAVDVSRSSALGALGAASAAWLAALTLVRSVAPSWAVSIVVVSGGIVLRLVFLVAEPELSDDLYRYVWEGALVAEGRDPYGEAPSAPGLIEYRERWPKTFEGVNHPSVPAAYPPLAQAVNAGLVALAGGPEPPARARFFLRAFYAGCDLLVCLPLAALLRQRRRSSAWLVAWAWNPWIALEFAGSGHLDSLAILCTLAALVCFPPGVPGFPLRGPGSPLRGPGFPLRMPGSPLRMPGDTGGVGVRRAGLGFGLLLAGAAVKLLPFALLPFVWRRARQPFRSMLLPLGGAVLALFFFARQTGGLPGATGLREYSFRWESFSLLYRWLEPPLARLAPYDETWSDPRRVARAAVLLAWMGIAFLAWRRRTESVRAAALLFGAFLVLTPTLHPWYLAWIAPFLPFLTRGPFLAWSLLLAAAPLLYWPIEGWRSERIWQEPAWLAPLLAGLFWSILALEGLRTRRAARR